MKYINFLNLKDYFQPVYDLENEVKSYWKSFIPNEKFYTVLSQTINSFVSNKAEERKSIWLQGTYGTGKSHATAVIKHLFFDDFNDIEDFVNNFENSQVKSKLLNFRRNKKVFPIVLKGTSKITNNKDFAFIIQKAVKKSLKNYGIEITTKSDFEVIISQLESEEINWEKFSKGTILELYGDKETIIKKLQEMDVTILKEIENLYSKKSLHIDTENIANWLDEVLEQLKNKNVADYIMIFWDEFTGIFELPNIGLILTELQSIAELSDKKGIYLFVVSHRRPHQTNISTEDVNKVLGRFKLLDYSMEPITTYHILNGAIKKSYNDEFIKFKERYIQLVRPIIDEISNNEEANIKKMLEDLFPFHPYTVYLATFIARNLGSTERSIFNFLYDENNGFKKFIMENPDDNKSIFLTVDYLWDFFYKEFENMENERVYSILERYKRYKDQLSEKGPEYLSVFKGILLLNILNRFVEVKEYSHINPSLENIRKLFLGVIEDQKLSNILTFFEEHQILDKTPDNLYLISNLGLPLREIEKEKVKLKSYYGSIENIIDKQKKTIETFLSSDPVREIELIIMDASLNEHLIKRKIENSFKKDYAVHLCLFLGKEQNEIIDIKNKLKTISKDYKDIIFVVSELIFDDKQFDKFIEYMARANVAMMHHFSEEASKNEEYANHIIKKWIDDVLNSGYVEWYLRNENGKALMREFGQKVNQLSKKIFKYGLENIEGTLKNKNIWTYKRSKNSIEFFLFAHNREDLEEKTKNNPYKFLREILKDKNGEYIVDSKLRIKKDVFDEHPLVKMKIDINKSFENVKGEGVFNLGENLSFLSKPPYGLYPNMVNMAAVGFLMREYIGKLFEKGTGIPIKQDVMRDKIWDLFDYWENYKYREKLNVRFGTEDEEKLIEILKDLFSFDDVKSLSDAKWKIRGWVKNIGFPLWVYKTSDKLNDKAKKAIDSILELIKLTDQELNYEKIKEFLNNIEDAKYDLKGIFMSNDQNYTPKELFKRWVLKKVDDEIPEKDTDFEKIYEYLKNNLPEEIALWTETNVNEKIQNWIIEYLKKTKTLPDDNNGNGGGGNGGKKGDDGGTENNSDNNGGKPPKKIDPKELENFKKRISKMSRKIAKKVLLNIVDDLKEQYPQALEIIKKHLEAI